VEPWTGVLAVLVFSVAAFFYEKRGGNPRRIAPVGLAFGFVLFLGLLILHSLGIA
jgi:hypothetical protein